MSLMDDDRGEDTTVRSLRCSVCGRCFIACGDAADDIVCACGAKLTPAALMAGVYEVKSLVPTDVRQTAPNGLKRPPLPQAEDLGYGASHGLPPGHEGPTGPGDAPAR